MFGLSKMAARAAVLATAALVAACAPQVNTSGGGKPTNAIPPGGFDPNVPVKIAVLAPSSASNAGAAALGKALVNSARMAAVDLNDPLIELAIYDTGGDAGTAAAAAGRAVADGAKLIVGPLFGANTKAIASTAAASNLKVLSFSTDSSAAGGPVFLTGFLPEKAATRVMNFAKLQGYSALGIFYPQTDYGQVALRGAQTALGPNLVVATPYERTEQGIPPASAEVAAKIKATGTRALLIAESGQALGFVAGQLGNSGIRPGKYRFLGLGEWNSRSTLTSKQLGGSWFPAPDQNAMQSFVQKYRGNFGNVPPQLAVLGYDAVQMAGQMLQEARATGSKDPFGFAAVTRPQGFQGAVGPIRFDSNGLGERGMAILEVGTGSFKTIDPAPVTFGAGS
ncbi:MAG: penicillin-binding protein activator [Pseudomonadota bacterium]